MKKWMLLSVVFGAMPLSMTAQVDDMYFVPTKETKAQDKAQYGIPRNTYYAGSSRSVDEYNRQGSYYQPIAGDSVSDIIDFSAVQGVYPDSVAEDFQLTKRMSRFDGYEPDQAYWAGYSAGYSDSWGWHSPWYYSWYDPWHYGRYGYYGWYDPWYYSWYDPWFYGSWGWGGYYRPYAWGGYYGGWGAPHYISTGTTGTQRHGRISYSGPRGVSNGYSTTYSGGTFGGSRTGSFGTSRSAGTRTYGTSGSSTRQSNQYGNFGGSRSSSSSAASSRSYTPSSSGSTGSFGGSRSGGGASGGGRSGGSFGGRR